jgi:Na+/H+ antiporter NhaC
LQGFRGGSFGRLYYIETIGAVLAGGSLGDNTSPLGETAILSSTVPEVPLMEHIRSELPYCLTGVGISTVLFIIFAILI